MTFDLPIIALMLGLAVAYMVIPAQWRVWALFIGSSLGVFALQPDLQIRWLDFLLPTLTLTLTVTTWYLTRKPEQGFQRDDWLALGILAGVIVLLALMRGIPADYRLFVASRPPPLWIIFVLVGIVLAGSLLLSRLTFSLTGIILVLIVLFVIQKTEFLATATSGLLRRGTGQDASLASAIDLGWLGFSYVAFRLIHTVRDRQSGILPAIGLREYLTYVVFFPAFIAGPIDRAERFLKDLENLPLLSRFDSLRFTEGCTRIGIGIFKKFVIADALAQGMSLDPTNAMQADNTFGLWILLYGYALRLFFDFAGYSDIAIGVGILFGIRLPENFKHPYLRTSITEFWQSWHITLSNWVRTYVFSPLSRTMIRWKPKPPSWLSVLIAQLATMIVIGLWHGVTVNFLIWGIWHTIGLWIHKQFTDRSRKWWRETSQKKWQFRAWSFVFWLMTFHFVVLGWVWFALPDFAQSIRVFGLLFGLK